MGIKPQFHVFHSPGYVRFGVTSYNVTYSLHSEMEQWCTDTFGTQYVTDTPLKWSCKFRTFYFYDEKYCNLFLLRWAQ